MIPGRSRSGSSASQAETPLTAYADEVAPTSGRTTPEQRWRSGKGEFTTRNLELIAAATASLLASDAKYKKFAGQVDKCLQSFESVNEWADFISFLSRLLKVNGHADVVSGSQLQWLTGRLCKYPHRHTLRFLGNSSWRNV